MPVNLFLYCKIYAIVMSLVCVVCVFGLFVYKYVRNNYKHSVKKSELQRHWTSQSTDLAIRFEVLFSGAGWFQTRNETVKL